MTFVKSGQIGPISINTKIYVINISILNYKFEFVNSSLECNLKSVSDFLSCFVQLTILHTEVGLHTTVVYFLNKMFQYCEIGF